MALFGLKSSALADGDRIEVAGAPVLLRVSSRSQRISLRLDRANRQIVAIAPSVKHLAGAVAFAQQRAAWINEQLQALPSAVPLAPGKNILILGEPCRLIAAGTPRARARWHEDGPDLALTCGGDDDDSFARAVVRALRAKALEVLSERTEFHATALGVPMPTVTIMDARGRWGSCRPARRFGFGAAASVGQIRYSWRLIMAPFEVMDYVAAHECAHLLEANHGPRFWALVQSLFGDPRQSRAWLRRYGSDLHAVG
jgi:predicted metal-dependent hydrolase